MAVTALNALENPTNFGALQTEQVKVWSRDLWKQARNLSFVNQFAGSGDNAMIQRITELKATSKGNAAYITLVHDLVGDGTMGDAQLEGYEEEMSQDDCKILFDQIRHANVSGGRMVEQKQVVNFREQSRDKLAYWAADRMDQMAFLTLSGVNWNTRTDGAARPVNAVAGHNLSQHESNAEVTAPSGYRHLIAQADGSVEFVADGASTADVVAGATLKYKHLVRAKAKAKAKHIRGIRGSKNSEIFHVFVRPEGYADLFLDSDFRDALLHAAPRDKSNPLFEGMTAFMANGMIIHEFRHVYNNLGLASGSRWGTGGLVAGQRVLICGAQALGMADLGLPYWNEEMFDYGNRPGIAVGKILGFKKPVFNSIYEPTGDELQDFGVICLDTAITP